MAAHKDPDKHPRLDQPASLEEHIRARPGRQRAAGSWTRTSLALEVDEHPPAIGSVVRQVRPFGAARRGQIYNRHADDTAQIVTTGRAGSVTERAHRIVERAMPPRAWHQTQKGVENPNKAVAVTCGRERTEPPRERLLTQSSACAGHARNRPEVVDPPTHVPQPSILVRLPRSTRS
jgi:hypothetical protein